MKHKLKLPPPRKTVAALGPTLRNLIGQLYSFYSTVISVQGDAKTFS